MINVIHDGLSGRQIVADLIYEKCTELLLAARKFNSRLPPTISEWHRTVSHASALLDARLEEVRKGKFAEETRDEFTYLEGGYWSEHYGDCRDKFAEYLSEATECVRHAREVAVVSTGALEYDLDRCGRFDVSKKRQITGMLQKINSDERVQIARALQCLAYLGQIVEHLEDQKLS